MRHAAHWASRFAAVIALTLVASTAVACGDDDGGSDGGPVTLRFTWWGNADRA